MIKSLAFVAVLAAYGSGTAASQERTSPKESGSLHPVWSPDGRWIAFESDRDGDAEIFVMAADGTQLRQLTRNNSPDQMPGWSPDGKTIRFMTGGHEHGHHQLFEVAKAGGPARPIEHMPVNPDSVESADHRFSVYAVADGNAPAGIHGGPSALFLKSGAAPPRRVSPPGHAEEPRLSPDEAWVVFEHRRPGDELTESLLYLVATDGKTPARRLTQGTNPTWSPDGRSILFKSWDAARATLVVSTISPDGSNLRHLADGVLPSWSRDGRRILFMAVRWSQWQVVVMSADGSDQRCLTCGDPRRP